MPRGSNKVIAPIPTAEIYYKNFTCEVTNKQKT